MNAICFLLTKTNEHQVFLRRYASFKNDELARKCPGKYSYHDARVILPDIVIVPDGEKWTGFSQSKKLPHDDLRWPQKCDYCDYVFKEDDEWQHEAHTLFQRSDNGEKTMLHDAPGGAMWYADWWPQSTKTPDGRTLIVRLPNGRDWNIDSQANNCTLPDDHEHLCWVRHGEPPLITVDKNGKTCNAGAGSILAGDWHGFLRNGVLEQC